MIQSEVSIKSAISCNKISNIQPMKKIFVIKKKSDLGHFALSAEYCPVGIISVLLFFTVMFGKFGSLLSD